MRGELVDEYINLKLSVFCSSRASVYVEMRVAAIPTENIMRIIHDRHMVIRNSKNLEYIVLCRVTLCNSI